MIGPEETCPGCDGPITFLPSEQWRDSTDELHSAVVVEFRCPEPTCDYGKPIP